MSTDHSAGRPAATCALTAHTKNSEDLLYLIKLTNVIQTCREAPAAGMGKTHANSNRATKRLHVQSILKVGQLGVATLGMAAVGISRRSMVTTDRKASGSQRTQKKEANSYRKEM